MAIELKEGGRATELGVADEATGLVDVEAATKTEAPSSGTTGSAGAKYSTPFSPRAGKVLKWSGVSFNVKDKTILDDVWGEVMPYKVCCIMGPSGAGKTSLLNVLAGRVAFQTGSVSLNGERINPVKEKSRFAYVMQEDAMFPCLTAREALFFSAKLRIPDSVTDDKKHELVDTIIKELSLEACADTLIGSDLIKGLSGGEKKRTAVGVELVTNPDMIFLDEPTSGLDSTSARRCIELLKQVCSAGTVVICTIHQPSSEIFAQFDQNILMKDGRIVYQGLGCKDGALQKHFESAGFPIPTYFNPSDFVMDLIQEKTLEQLEESGVLMAAPASEKHASSSGELPELKATSSFATQIYWLGWREFVTLKRNPIGALIPFIIDGILHLIFGLIFQGVGNGDPAVPDELNAHFGALSFVIISAMFGTGSTALLTFPIERPLFLREYSNGTYGATAYFLSKLYIEMPLQFIKNIYCVMIVYWLMAWQGSFILHAMVLWLLCTASGSVALLLGSLTESVESANQLSPLVYVPQLLFSGFFIRLELVPVYLRWAQYLCSLKYAVNLGAIVEFWQPCDVDACSELLEINDMYPDKVWLYVLLLFVLIAVPRIGALRVLMQKAKHVY